MPEIEWRRSQRGQVPQKVCCTRSSWSGWRGVTLVSRSVFIRSRQNVKQFLEGTEILMRDSRSERGLHEVIARDEGRVHRLHGGAARIRICGFFRQTPAPAHRPGVIGGWVCEQRAYGSIALRTRRRGAQPAECQGEVGAVLCHARQQILGYCDILLAVGGEPDLALQAREIGLPGNAGANEPSDSFATATA